jgi:rfaE bifunctional protein kinase chain/domain
MKSKKELKDLLQDIQKVRIGVIGDFCIDAYWFLDESASEISVETRLPTRPVRRQRYSLGGAGNVVRNLLDLGAGRVCVYGVVGPDPFGHQMRQLLQGPRVDLQCLMTQTSDWDTHVYTKPYVQDKEQSRIDFGNFNTLSDPVAADMLARLEARLGDLDMVVINEQVMRGIHNSEFFRGLLGRLISRHPDRRFILDSRHFADCYEGAMHKINEHEAARRCGMRHGPGEPVPYDNACKAAETLWARFKRPVFVSRGARGALVCDEKGVQEVPGLLILGCTDAVGAGDSMLAGISAALAAGRDNLTAAILGNLVAGVTVRKLFITGTATPAEIMAIGEGLDENHRVEPASAPVRRGESGSNERARPDVPEIARRPVLGAPRRSPGPRSALKIERLHGDSFQGGQAWVRLSPPDAKEAENGVVEIRVKILVPSSNKGFVEIGAFDSPPNVFEKCAFRVRFYPDGRVKYFRDADIEIPGLKLRTDEWQDILICADTKRACFELTVGEQTAKDLPFADNSARRLQTLALCPNTKNGTLYVAGVTVNR